ncbi:MAG TPA: hypothetical protein VMR52_11810 [Dehalococcoidia bacterium]|nr:hypothetical protein [Dehalococcoidia bacterium]
MARAPTQKKQRDWLAESDYWDSLSIDEILAMSEPADDVTFVDRRPKKAISLRLTGRLIDEGKKAASEVGIGYQTLFRMWIIDGLKRYKIDELEQAAKRGRKSA